MSSNSLSTTARRWFSWDANPQRALALSAIGAAVGLSVAGFGLFTAKGASSRFVPSEDVALVNQRPILFTDFSAQLETEFSIPVSQATPRERAKVLNDMIREELFVQRGLELDLPSSDPDTRTALVAGVEQQSQVDATSAPPSDAELLAFYTAHKDRYSTEGRMLLRDLVPASTNQAGAAGKAAAAALAQGRSPQALLQSSAWKDSGRVKEEEFYFAAKIHLGDAIYEAAKGLKDGQAAVFNAPDGPHLLAMARNIPPVAQSFDAAKATVANDYRSDLSKREEASEAQYLHDKAEILINPAFRR